MPVRTFFAPALPTVQRLLLRVGRWVRHAPWLLLPMAAQAAAPAVALYYGKELPHTDFRAFDIVVIEPDHAPAAGGEAPA